MTWIVISIAATWLLLCGAAALKVGLGKGE